MRILSKSACLTAMTLFASTIATAAPYAAGRDREIMDGFQLWNGCKPVGLFVSGLSNDVKALGLRKKMVEAAVRSRLRGARIYQKSLNPYLNVRIGAVSSAVIVTFDFLRPVAVILPPGVRSMKKTPWTGFASTWTRGSIGAGIATPERIMSAVSEHADTFIDEYLRVNAKACTVR